MCGTFLPTLSFDKGGLLFAVKALYRSATILVERYTEEMRCENPQFNYLQFRT